MGFSTPIGFLIFNRPELTERVFHEIAKVQPQTLFVIADGPRLPEEEEKCQNARAVIERVDWDCDVLTNYSEKNLGCGYREASGFSWVFSQVAEAIFLEDDTLPTPSFFSFCQELLEYYRHDERIMHISGNNFQFGQHRTPYSYFFSRYPHSWGWASWRRAWQHYDYYMSTWPEFKQAGLLEALFDDQYERQYWGETFERTYANPVNDVADTWDYQWCYTIWSQNGLAIYPNANLVSNLGFGHPDAVHTKDTSDRRSNLPCTDIWEIKHPKFVIRHREADAYTFDHVFGGAYMKHQAALKHAQSQPQLSRVRYVCSQLKHKVKLWLES